MLNHPLVHYGAGTILGAAALFHATRLALGWQLVVNNWTIPLSVSWAAIFLAGCFSMFLFATVRYATTE